MPLVEGEIVGPYRIIGQLGQGGMATVYKGYHQNLDRYVAIKMMHQGFLEDPTFLARFKREAQIVAKLEHPHIVPVYDFNEYNGQPYLVMKYIEGSTLKDDTTHSTLPMRQIIHIMTAVGSALTYAHERGVLHRDIKPSNIVIDKDNVPYVTDFGLARMVQAGESTMSQDMILGTPHYISPEQAKGSKDIDARADIYSLGVVLYKLVVGQVPFTGETPYAIIHEHIYTPLPLPSAVNPDVSPQVEVVLLKALAKDPADRYGSAVEMVDAFKEAVRQKPASAKPKATSATQKRAQQSTTVVLQKTPKLVAIPAPGGAEAAIAPARPQRSRTRRILSGAAVLLVICLASAVIVPILSKTPSKPADSTTPGSDVPTSATIPTLDVPHLSIQAAQAAVRQQPDDATANLALAEALWKNNQPDEAMRAVNDGRPKSDNPIVYLVNAARIAETAAQNDAASNLYVQSLVLSQGNGELYPAVRAEAGQFLYQMALTARRLTLRDARQIMTRIPRGQVPVAEVMIARALIESNHLALAEQMLRPLLAENAELAEIHLVAGEMYQAQGAQEQATSEWEAAQTAEDSPEWVSARAAELIQLTSGA